MSEETIVNKIDLDQLDGSLVEEKIELNPDANPMEAPPPVIDGTHRMKIVLKDDSFEFRTTKPGKDGNKRDYIAAQFSGIVVAEGSKENNKRVFGRVNTLSFDGKSEMGYILLQIWGGAKSEDARKKLAELTNYVDLAKAFKAALAAEPIIRVSTRWEARYNAGTKEEPEYKTALTGMNQFPSDGAGGKRPFFTVKGQGEVPAQAVIKDYFPDEAVATA